jgi:anti-sigma factor RsiW
MTCEETRILLHALIDGELDAGHASEVEAHVASCPGCAVQLRDYRVMRQALAAPALRHQAPAALRARIEGALPSRRAVVPIVAPSRRSLLKGMAMGSVLSGALAASLVVFVMRNEEDQRILGDVVSAHLRSLQGDHLIDVQSTDQHTVKPWFNGRLEVAPPVIDLTAQGFTLIGGRLDYIDGRPVAAIVYKRRAHVINLFVAPVAAQATTQVTTQIMGPERRATLEQLQGFNIWRWTRSDLGFWAVSDINAEELQEFGEKLEVAVRSGG